MTTKRQREEEAVEDYVWSIQNRINRDWTAYNAILIEEFGLPGLKRIKRKAWSLIEGRKA